MAPPRVSAFRPDQLWQTAREPIFWLDPTLRVAWVNKAWEALTGHPAESVVGLVCAAHAPTQPGEAADLVASFCPPPEAVAGHPSGCPTVILHSGGERLWRRVEFWPFRDQNDALLGILGQVREAGAFPSVADSKSHELRVRLMELRGRLYHAYGIESLIGTGPAHERLLGQVRLAAASRVPVLVVGEPGTGKRLVARTIHHMGVDSRHPLVPIDCEALPPEVLERELFGVGRQAAERSDRRPDPAHASPVVLSRLSPGDGSTLLIGDILALPRDLQARLAGSLDGRVRLIATTAGDPEAALKDESLRPELYHAITVLVIRLDPLRRRRQDLPLLAQHLLERVNQRVGSLCGGFTPRAAAAIEAYDWPGNVRELARVIDAAHGHLQDRVRRQSSNEPKHRPAGPDGTAPIDIDDLPSSIRGNLGAAFVPPPLAAAKPLDELLTEIERRLIETALTRARQNKSRAAELLGISRPRLYRRIKELSLPDDDVFEPADIASNVTP